MNWIANVMAASTVGMLTLVLGACDVTEPLPAPQPEPDMGLFACGFASACPHAHMHLDVDPPEAQECAARLAVEEQPAVLTADESLGGGVWETESLIIFPGDGTAIVHSRHRDCVDCEPAALPWENPTTDVCEIQDIDALTEACAGDEDEHACRWNMWNDGALGLANCEPASESYDCAQIESLLGTDA